MAQEEEFKNGIKRDVETRAREGVEAVLEEVLEEGMAKHLKVGYREFTPTRVSATATTPATS